MSRQEQHPTCVGSKNLLSRLLGAVVPAALVMTALTAAPAPAQAGIGDFKIVIEYNESDNEYFTDRVKEQIEWGARFLEKFIADDRTLTVKVVANDRLGAQTFASGAASEFETNSDEKCVPIKGGIAYNTSKSLISARDQGGDIRALTVHELMHVLGFTDHVKAFASRTKGGKFMGEHAMRMNNGEGVPVESGHFPAVITNAQGKRVYFTDADGVKPRMTNGGGNLLSVLDLAVLKDLGYDIPQVPDSDERKQPHAVLKSADGKHSGEGDGAKIELEGLAGDDTLIADKDNTEIYGDYSSASPVEDPPAGGKDTFVIQCKKVTIKDLDVDKDVILLSPDLVGEGGIEALLKDPQRFIKEPTDASGRFTPGTYLLKLGDTEVTIGTKHKASYFTQRAPRPAPTAENFKIGTYEAP